MENNAADYRAIAANARAESAASFERCDTDGFVSQFVNDRHISPLNEAKATIADQGGNAEFDALFDLNGNIIDAVKRQTKFGMSWVDVNGKWYNPSKASNVATRVKNNRAKGFYVGRIMAPADGALAGGGKGFSGLASVYVDIYRTTKGITDIEIIDNGLTDIS